MDKETFTTFGKFKSKEEAMVLVSILDANKIQYLLEDYSITFEPTFGKDKVEDEFRIKLKQQDFPKVDALLSDEQILGEEETEKSYYLFDFSNQELMDVVAKADEWSKFDFDLAQWILKERGQEVRPEVVVNMKKKRIEDLAKPDGYSMAWIYLGYFSALFGGLPGVIIGSHLKGYKKKLPNGERVYGYTEQVRSHGRKIVFICMISLLIFTVYNIIY